MVGLVGEGDLVSWGLGDLDGLGIIGLVDVSIGLVDRVGVQIVEVVGLFSKLMVICSYLVI